MEQTKEQKKSKRGCIMGLIVGPVFIIIMCISFCSGPTEEEKAAQRKSDREFTVEVLSRQFVEGRLKSPSSAEFSNIQIKQENDSVYRVFGVVDSQNDYGAMLRSRYHCVVELKSDSTGVCNYLTIE